MGIEGMSVAIGALQTQRVLASEIRFQHAQGDIGHNLTWLAGIAIGGDVFPGSTLSDHCLRYQNIPQIKLIVVLGELGGQDEYSLVGLLLLVAAQDTKDCHLVPAEFQRHIAKVVSNA